MWIAACAGHFYLQISYDRGKHKALICSNCSEEVKKSFDLLEKIRRADAYYFQSRRDEAYEGEVNNAPSESASSSATGTSRQGRSGDKKPKASAATAKNCPGKPFKCHVCEKIFSLKQHLLMHIESIHEKIRRFACDFCPTKCYLKSNLCVHISWECTWAQNHVRNSNVTSKVARNSFELWTIWFSIKRSTQVRIVIRFAAKNIQFGFLQMSVNSSARLVWSPSNLSKVLNGTRGMVALRKL